MKLFKNLSGYKRKKKFRLIYTRLQIIYVLTEKVGKVEFYPLEDEENIVHEYNDIVRLRG